MERRSFLNRTVADWFVVVIILYLLAADSVYVLADSPFTQVGPPLFRNETYDGIGFGAGVAISRNGQVAVVLGSRLKGGSVWMLQYTSSQWTFVAQLTPDDLPLGASLAGRSVSISQDGKYVAFGSESDYIGSTGSAWVFNRTSDTAWTQMGSLIRPLTAAAGDYWGRSLSLANDGTTLVLGSRTQASASVFTLKENGSWTQTAAPISSQSSSTVQDVSCSLNGNGTYMALGV